MAYRGRKHKQTEETGSKASVAHTDMLGEGPEDMAAQCSHLVIKASWDWKPVRPVEEGYAFLPMEDKISGIILSSLDLVQQAVRKTDEWTDAVIESRTIQQQTKAFQRSAREAEKK